MCPQRRVADQHGALPVNGAARDAREWGEVALADPREAAEALAERRLQLRAERVDGQRRDALGVALGLRPDHGAAAARERQQRNGPALRETFERPAVEPRLRAAVEDDGALAVVVR